MAERRGNWQKAEDDLPVYLARPGTADQVPRQKYGGLFCSVEDAFESKTIDFDALSVGQRGSRTPRTAQRETGEEARSPASCDQSTAGEESPAANRRGGKDSPQVETRTSGDKEVLQNLGDEKVRGLELRRDWRLVSAARVFFLAGVVPTKSGIVVVVICFISPLSLLLNYSGSPCFPICCCDT